MRTIIVGLGGMGSAAAAHLAMRGRRVIGIERFTPAHDRGSSHGRSRIIRQAYFEGAAYVPLLRRAYELWEDLERDTSTHLLTITGGLMIGKPDSAVITGSVASAREHGLEHELLDATEIHRRFPPLLPSPELVALYEPMAGFVDPERCTLAHQQLATNLGAELHFNEPMLSWESTSSGVRVTTTRATYEADSLVLAPGPWAPDVFGDLALPLTIERQVMYWLDPIGGIDAFHPDRFPIYIWELDDGVHFYGFPSQGDGVKVACYHGGAFCEADTVDCNVSADEIARMRELVANRIPALRGPLLNAITCMYTNTPDLDFILGMHPRYANVVVASPCSGHGYKFASVIGEILADLATDGTTPHPIERFTPSRFAR